MTSELFSIGAIRRQILLQSFCLHVPNNVGEFLDCIYRHVDGEDQTIAAFQHLLSPIQKLLEVSLSIRHGSPDDF